MVIISVSRIWAFAAYSWSVYMPRSTGQSTLRLYGMTGIGPPNLLPPAF